MKKKLLCVLAVLLCLGVLLCSCTAAPEAASPSPSPSESGSPSPSPSVSPSPSQEVPSPSPSGGEERPVVEVAMLKGPTGMGAAKLMADAAGGATEVDYRFTLAAAPDEVTVKLVSGELDLAALPTNVAASLYAKTDGGVQMLCVNTLGVLYILEKGDSVHSLADLRGRTLYATGQGSNPEYVLNYLLEENGLDPAGDVDIQWKTSDELTALMGAGEIELCMLPVPAATGVLMKNDAVRAALDLSAQWEGLRNDSLLTQGCVVARTQFIQAHPELVEAFLEDYSASVAYMTGDGEDRAQLCAELGIIPSAGVAAAALPQANLVYMDGETMQNAVQGYFEVLWRADEKSIGGSIPDDGFYYYR